MIPKRSFPPATSHTPDEIAYGVEETGARPSRQRRDDEDIGRHAAHRGAVGALSLCVGVVQLLGRRPRVEQVDLFFDSYLDVVDVERANGVSDRSVLTSSGLDGDLQTGRLHPPGAEFCAPIGCCVKLSLNVVEGDSHIDQADVLVTRQVGYAVVYLVAVGPRWRVDVEELPAGGDIAFDAVGFHPATNLILQEAERLAAGAAEPDEEEAVVHAGQPFGWAGAEAAGLPPRRRPSSRSAVSRFCLTVCSVEPSVALGRIRIQTWQRCWLAPVLETVGARLTATITAPWARPTGRQPGRSDEGDTATQRSRRSCGTASARPPSRTSRGFHQRTLARIVDAGSL